VHRKIYKSQTITNYRIIQIFTIEQVSSRTTEQIYKRTPSIQAVKMFYFLVILIEIIVTFIT